MEELGGSEAEPRSPVPIAALPFISQCGGETQGVHTMNFRSPTPALSLLGSPAALQVVNLREQRPETGVGQGGS